jgi:hypothetical protein
MNKIKSIVSVVFLASAMSSSVVSAADGVISKNSLTEGSYCHLKFPAIREETLASSHPVLQDASSGDIIDFYGPCDHDPLGKEEIQSQKLEHQHRFEREFSS